MSNVSSLPELVRCAGASMSYRDGEAVVAHYGSAAGELAVCLRAVGLAWRSDLSVLAIESDGPGLEPLLDRLLSSPLARGGALLESGAWWCRRQDMEEVLVICRRAQAPRILAALAQDVSRITAVSIHERSNTTTVLNVVGHRTQALLADLGLLGPAADPRDVAPFASCDMGGVPVTLLLESASAALALVDSHQAAAAWSSIEQAGRGHDLSCVGLESIERYAVTQRAARQSLRLL